MTPAEWIVKFLTDTGVALSNPKTLAAALGGRLLVRSLEDYAAGRIHPLPQPAEGATRAPRLTSEDGKLDPTRMSAEEMDRRVRALGERIGTWITVGSVELKVFRGHADGQVDEGIEHVQARARHAGTRRLARVVAPAAGGHARRVLVGGMPLDV